MKSGDTPAHTRNHRDSSTGRRQVRAQIAITRNSVTQASSDKGPPDGGILARRANSDFRISLHRHVSETALIQMMRALRALDPAFEMSLEMAGNVTGSLSR